MPRCCPPTAIFVVLLGDDLHDHRQSEQVASNHTKIALNRHESPPALRRVKEPYRFGPLGRDRLPGRRTPGPVRRMSVLLCIRRCRRGLQGANVDHQDQGANCACRTLSRIVVPERSR